MFRKHKLLSLGFIILSLNLFGQRYNSYSGIVKDSVTGKALEGVDVVVKNLSTGTLSSAGGEFMLYLDAGNYEVTFSRNGYHPVLVTLSLNRPIENETILMSQVKADKQTNAWLRKLQNSIISPTNEPLVDLGTAPTKEPRLAEAK